MSGMSWCSCAISGGSEPSRDPNVSIQVLGWRFLESRSCPLLSGAFGAAADVVAGQGLSSGHAWPGSPGRRAGVLSDRACLVAFAAMVLAVALGIGWPDIARRLGIGQGLDLRVASAPGGSSSMAARPSPSASWAVPPTTSCISPGMRCHEPGLAPMVGSQGLMLVVKRLG
jgi:hypothetical protein